MSGLPRIGTRHLWETPARAAKGLTTPARCPARMITVTDTAGIGAPFTPLAVASRGVRLAGGTRGAPEPLRPRNSKGRISDVEDTQFGDAACLGRRFRARRGGAASARRRRARDAFLAAVGRGCGRGLRWFQIVVRAPPSRLSRFRSPCFRDRKRGERKACHSPKVRCHHPRRGGASSLVALASLVGSAGVG